MANIRDELLDELLKETENPAEFWGEKGLLAELKKRLIERALNAELDEELGYFKHDPKGNKSGNSRNGHGKKKIFAGTDQIDLRPPRDRNGTFNPKLIPKGQKRFDGFDEKIIAMYARGMSVRDMQSLLEELYSVEVSEGFISMVTDAVLEDVKAWQSRPLSPIYPIVFLDGLVVKSREEGPVRNKTVYLALGIDMDGQKELLGLWIAPTEGAKFWLSVITELKNRGLEDIFIACVDGLKGFPEAIESVYPETEVQLCIVHMIRNSLKYVSWKDRKALAASLKEIYVSATVEEAESQLEALGDLWGEKYPSVYKSWRECK